MPQSARLPRQKIAVECDCGKMYRVPASKAGSKFECKGCGLPLEIPLASSDETASADEISEADRRAILSAAGIDPDEASKKFQAEQDAPDEGSAGFRVYHCTRCEASMDQNTVAGAYVDGELVCSECRSKSTAGAAGKRRTFVDENGTLISAPDESVALRSAAGIGALLFFGIFAPLWVVVGLSAVKAVLVALAIAGGAGFKVYRARTA